MTQAHLSFNRDLDFDGTIMRQFWGDAEWDRVEADEIRRWVFQPSGMASPVRIRLRTEDVEVEAWFDALTGEVVRERTDFLSPNP